MIATTSPATSTLTTDEQEQLLLIPLLRTMPKVELHAHLNGCIRSSTLRQLAKERRRGERRLLLSATKRSSGNDHHQHPNGTSTPSSLVHPKQQLEEDHWYAGNTGSSTKEDEDKEWNFFYNTQPRSLRDCFDLFREIAAAVCDLRALRRITHEALTDFAAHHVAYLELRSTPKRLLFVRDDDDCWCDARQGQQRQQQQQPHNNDNRASKQDYIETVLQVMQAFEADEEERYQSEMADYWKLSKLRQQQQQLQRQQQPQRSDHHDPHNENDDLTTLPLPPPSSSSAPPPPRLPITCRLIISVDRSQSVEDAMEHVELAISMQQQQQQKQQRSKKYIVGVDLGGNPVHQSFAIFRPAFERARAAGLRVTLHCAECPSFCESDDDDDHDDGNDDNGISSTRNVGDEKDKGYGVDKEQQIQRRRAYHQEAVDMIEFRPDRLGHALLLPRSLRRRLLWECSADARIPIETCPTSNVMTLELHHHDHQLDQQQQHLQRGSLVAGLRRHPALAEWLQAGYPLAICTDDPGIFDTTPTQELVLLVAAFPHLVDPPRLAHMVISSLNYAFCDDMDVMKQIRQRVQERMSWLLSR